MKRSHWIALCTALIALALLAAPAGAQSDSPTDTPTVTPTAVPPTATPTAVPTQQADQPGAKFFTHPIVRLLDAFFGKLMATPTPIPSPTPTLDPAITPDPLATPTPLATPEPEGSASGLTPVGEDIAAYHEAGLGFGELVKIYSLVKASQEACAAQSQVNAPDAEPCVPLTVEELVEQVESGTGMGQLFKEYGKPPMMGVGHVRKAVRNQESQPTPEATLTAMPEDDQGQPKDDRDTGKPEDKDKDHGKEKERGQDKPDKAKDKPKDKGKGNK